MIIRSACRHAWLNKSSAWRAVRPYSTLPYDPAPALDAQGRIPAAPYTQDPLCGTAPEYKTHLLVWPAEKSRPSSTWPESLPSVSPLVAELAGRRGANGSMAGYGVTFAQGASLLPSPQVSWNPQTVPAQRVPPGHVSEDEKFWLYAYRAGKVAKYPDAVSLNTLPSGKDLAAQFDRLLEEPDALKSEETHIYVCTHGTVDCRCGVVGGNLVEELKEQVRRHEADCQAKGTRPSRKVRVIPVSHIGGHKFAANALVYPHGDWYGNLRVSDAPLLLRAALAPASSYHDLDDTRERLVVWPRWRGRLGMSQLEQNEHYSLWGPPVVYSANITPRARVGAPVASAAGESDKVPAATAASEEALRIRFRSPEGEWFNIDAEDGESIMEIARRHDLPGIEATCGGDLECATCHAYVCGPSADENAEGALDTPAPEDAGLGAVSDEEDDMLEYTSLMLAAAAPKRAFSTSSAAQLARMQLIGRLVASPETRLSRTGKEYLRYTVATSDPLGPPNEDGSPAEPTSSFHSVFAFGEERVNRLRDLPKG
ncbi:lipoyl synthase [Malassezia cuniculi]|uniref:Lipoyl synthase n=1 Tax=Malassezia cuniculi TaxID=948313 RepID=A0AAF0EW80_9BASI|nr:lipoyl synthase [Malassezia cuniculi]